MDAHDGVNVICKVFIKVSGTAYKAHAQLGWGHLRNHYDRIKSQVEAIECV